MSAIFLCYRRNDCGGRAGRLYDLLVAHFGPEHVFMDVDTLDPGVDFINEIESAVEQCDILLALIGPGWLNTKDKEGRRRIDDPKDFVHLEVSTALKLSTYVVPVLFEDAPMPRAQELPEAIKALARRQSHEISDSRFHYDSQTLIKKIEKRRRKKDTVEGQAKKISDAETDKPDLSLLWADALEAFYTRHWKRAVELLNHIVASKPDFKDAAAKLETASRILRIETLYEAGQKAHETGDWNNATDLLQQVATLDADYKKVQALMADAIKQQKLANLYDEAHQLHQRAKWQAVVNVFQKIGECDPKFPDPDRLLETAQAEMEAAAQESALEKIYHQGLQRMDSAEWSEALRCFHQVQQQRAGYREVETLITQLEELEYSLDNLRLTLTPTPRNPTPNQPVKWRLVINNKSEEAFSEVTLQHKAELLTDPFDLAAGKRRQFSFNSSYSATGSCGETVELTMQDSLGHSVAKSITAAIEVSAPKITKKRKRPAASRNERFKGKLETALKQAKKRLTEKGFDTDFHLPPHIPLDKLENARAANNLPESEHACALIDLTVFGSAKDCLLFGNKTIYHSMFGELQKIPYHGLSEYTIDSQQSFWTNAVYLYHITTDETIEISLSGSTVPSAEVADLLREIQGFCNN